MERSNNPIENTQSHDLEVVTPPLSLEEKSAPRKRKTLLIFAVVLAFILVIAAWMTWAGLGTVKALKEVAFHSSQVGSAIEARDLAKAKAELDSTRESFGSARQKYNLLAPFKYIPFFGSYFKDVEHAFNAGSSGLEAGDLAILALEPYADVLGFSGNQEKLEFQSAEERIIFLANTVEKLAPQMDEIGAKLKYIDNELSLVNELRYPKSLFGKEVRPKIITLKKTVNSASESIGAFQPFIKLLPTLLGNPEPKRYLILFQNDGELRPTGGFLTAYATMNVLKGKIEPGVSEDIYTLDNSFNSKVPAPDPIKKYLPLVYNWYLRDMNLSPDFKTSMDTFTEYYKKTPVAPEVDAIIAIDTHVPVRLLEVLGPIGVPGYGGKFSAEPDPRCDNTCPQVIYELENIITRPTYEIREGRKSILGPLMNSMFANMMGSPKAKWAEFFAIFTDSIREKHLLMYFYDQGSQEAVEALGAAGRINSYSGDYLHINDTNFAGAKSNLFVEQEVAQEIQVEEDGSINKKITLTYKNPSPPSNCNLEAGQLCLNGILRDWIRVYVPQGSTLNAGRGFEVDMTSTSDLGHTVFEGFFTLAPQSVKKLEIEYKVPAGLAVKSGNDWELPLLIQKQPGTKLIPHTITFNNGKPKVYEINSDSELNLSK